MLKCLPFWKNTILDDTKIHMYIFKNRQSLKKSLSSEAYKIISEETTEQ